MGLRNAHMEANGTRLATGRAPRQSHNLKPDDVIQKSR